MSAPAAETCANSDCVSGEAEVECPACGKTYCRGHAKHEGGHQRPADDDRP